MDKAHSIQPSTLQLIPRKRKLVHSYRITKQDSTLKIPSLFSRLPGKLETKICSKNSISDCDELDSFDLPHYVMIAFDSLLQRQSYGTCKLTKDSSEVIVFVLKSILNQSVWTKSSNSEQNRIASSIASTDFHIELEQLCLQGELKLIQLQGLDGEEDTAVFRMADYIQGVKAAFNELESCLMGLNDLFVDSIQSFQSTHIKAFDLLRMMNNKNQRRKMPVLFSEKWIFELVRLKVLLPRNRSGSTNVLMSSFWFTLPMLSDSAKLLADGRRRITLRLKRAPNTEIKRTTLETSTTGGFSGPFHVRDLLAKGLVLIKDSANGQFVKLVSTMTSK